jgi:hypothetical protein
MVPGLVGQTIERAGGYKDAPRIADAKPLAAEWG